MLKKITIIAIITVLVCGLVSIMGCRRHAQMGQVAFMMDYLTEALDLTDDQQALLKQYVGDVMKKGMELKKNQAIVRQAVIEQFKNDAIDQQYILNLIARNKSKSDEMTQLVIQRFSDFHQMLTPEQRAKLLKKIEDSKKFREARLDRVRNYFQNKAQP